MYVYIQFILGFFLYLSFFSLQFEVTPFLDKSSIYAKKNGLHAHIQTLNIKTNKLVIIIPYSAKLQLPIMKH